MAADLQCHAYLAPPADNPGLLRAGIRKAYFGSADSEGIVPVTCEALAVFALNPVSHRSLKAAATFQSTLNLLSCLRLAEKSRLETFETKELVSHWRSPHPRCSSCFRVCSQKDFCTRLEGLGCRSYRRPAGR